MIKNHIDKSDFNKLKNDTFEISIKTRRAMNNNPEIIKAVDQTENFKNIATKSNIKRRILFLASTLWTKVLNVV